MAPETRNKKRKSISQPAAAPTAAPKKLKKSEPQEAAAKPVKPAKTEKGTEGKVPKAAAKKSARSHATDFFDDSGSPNENEAPAATNGDAAAVATKKGVKKQPKKKEEPKKKVVEKEPEVLDLDEEDEDGSDEDDQTAALLRGFESSDEEGEDAATGPEVAITTIPELPDTEKTRKALEKVRKEEAESEPGVIYVGRIPHGFYEHQMQAYFSQFGTILRLRLSRNRRTGRSRHYAFIEFASANVARIVAETMDKYLLFGHILQVRTIPKEQVHEQLFKNANRRFKLMPRNKMEGTQLRKGTTREGWSKRVGAEEKRRESKKEKLKALGYEFTTPKLRQVQDIPVREVEPKSTQDGAAAPTVEPEQEEETPKLLTEEPHNEDVVLEDIVNKNEPKVTEKVKARKAKQEKSADAPAPKAKKTKKATKA